MTLSPKTVLVVDDDPGIVDLLCLFIDDERFHAVGAKDGQEAVKLARSLRPDLVLCDWSMPRTDGAEVIRALRADPQTANLKIVLMSGHQPPNLRELGADAFLAKPFGADAVFDMLATAAMA